MTNEISLKIDEPNELKFKIKIQGSSSESGGTKQFVRLVITEANNPQAMGLMFPVQSTDEENLLVFTIPPLSGIVQSDVEYVGKIEVMIGTRIFSPMTLNIVFIRDMSVEVVSVSSPQKHEQEKAPTPSKVPEPEREDISKLLEEIEKKPSQLKPAVVQAKKQVTLTRSELEALLAAKRQQTQVNAAGSKPTLVQRNVNEGFKNSFKDLMRSALEETSSTANDKSKN